MMKHCIALVLSAVLAPACLAQDAVFNKTKFSSVKMPRQIDVTLRITDSAVKIDGSDRKSGDAVNLTVPFTSIDSLTYELAERHRVREGAAVMVASLGAGAILMATKTKSHWLDIAYRDNDQRQTITLHLDKSEYQDILSALESRTGKHIAMTDAKSNPENPTAGSRDINELVPFGPDAVAAALRPAMESMGCQVEKATPNEIECKRARSNGGGIERTGVGGERVVAKLEASGGKTRVRIETEKGFSDRLSRKNWSTPIYQELLKQFGPQTGSLASSHPD